MKETYLNNISKDSKMEKGMFEDIFKVETKFERSEYIEDARRIYKSFGRLKEFDKKLNAFIQDNIQFIKEQESNKTGFIDPPNGLVLNCGRYIANDEGVCINEIRKDGEVFKIVACPHPILVTERLVNIDTDTEKAKITFFRDGRWRSLIVDVNLIFNKTRLCDLSDRGIIVTSESAKDLVKYFSTIMQLNEKNIPLYKSIARLGWIEKDFAPYVEDVKYDGDLDFLSVYECVREHGDYKAWKEHMYELRKKKEVRRVMAASFASALIEKVSALPFVLHLWGKTGGGKTVTLMVAASIWGNPDYGKLVRTMNMTANAMARTAAFLYSVPFCADELQQIKDRWNGNYDNLIMKMCEGIDRGKAKARGGIEDMKTWRNAFILTGEEPVTKANSGGGVKNRCIVIEIKDQIIPDGHKTANIVKEHYGYAGKAFTDYVKDISIADMQRDYKELFEQIMGICDTTEKQAYSMALLLLADRYSCECVFMDDLPIELKEVKEYLTDAKAVDPSERAWEWLQNWIAENSSKFLRKDQEYMYSGETWGAYDYDKKDAKKTYTGVVTINKTVLERSMNNCGFDFNACKKDWARDGRLVKNSEGRYLHQTTVGGSKGTFVKVNFGDKEKFVTVDPDEMPFE